MLKKYLPFCLLAVLALTNVAGAQQPAAADKPAPATVAPAKTNASATAKVDPVVMTNQMMLVFMERMKSGNLKEARDVANEMVFGHDSYKITEQKDYKSFHSAMEKELYIMMEKASGGQKAVEWVEQPVSDGFYFLAILDFQEGKHEDALLNLQKAIYWNPVRSAFYAERGFMFLRKNSGPDILNAQIAYQKALELADNAEDFAAALRGLAFVLVERRELEQALSCLIVSKEYDATNADADEEIQFIKGVNADLVASMTIDKAREVMKAAGILTSYAPEHVQVLLTLADSYKAPEDAQKALMLLKKAREMAPQNAEVSKRLKALEK